MFVFYAICAIIVVTVVILCFYQNRIYMIPTWKVFAVSVTMIVAGTVGTFLLAYFELGYWGGKSFFGCIFLGVPALYVLSCLIRVPPYVLMDMAGPVCAVFLGLIKINCWYQHCCFGMVLYYREDGTRVRFPSQIVETISGFILCIVLLYLQKNPKHRGLIAQYFLVSYGSVRFILNFFRDNLETIWFLKDFKVFVPQGHLWGLVCVVWGLLWLEKMRKKKNDCCVLD